MARRRLYRQVLSPEQRFVARTLALGELHAAQTLAAMRPVAAARFVQVMRGLGSLYAEQVEALLREDGAGLTMAEDLVLEGEAQVRRLLMRALGPDDMRDVMAILAAERAAPNAAPVATACDDAAGGAACNTALFAPLLGAPPGVLARLLTGEGLIVTIAVLRHLARRDGRLAAAVLGTMPLAWTGHVAMGLAPNMGGESGAGPERCRHCGPGVHPGSFEALLVAENALCCALPEEHSCRVLDLSATQPRVEGVSCTALAAVLRHGGDAVRKAALHALRARHGVWPQADAARRDDAEPQRGAGPPDPADDDAG